MSMNVAATRYDAGMIETYADARDAVAREIAPLWGDTRGTFFVDEIGFEDEHGWLVPWGAREYIVDGDRSYLIMNGAATFVDRLTGFVEMTTYAAEIERINAMREVSA